MTIEHMVVLKLNKIELESLMQFASEVHIKKIYIPPWDGVLAASDQHLFDQFIEQTTAQNTCVLFLTPDLCIHTEGLSLYANKLKKQLKWHETPYQSFQIKGMITGNAFHCMPPHTKELFDKK